MSAQLDDQWDEASLALLERQANPLRAVGFAAGIDLLLGLWIGRRRLTPLSVGRSVVNVRAGL